MPKTKIITIHGKKYLMYYSDELLNFNIGDNNMREVKHRAVGIMKDKIQIFAEEGNSEYSILMKCHEKEQRLPDEFLNIRFQKGNPLEEVNGITVESLLSLIIDRHNEMPQELKTREGALFVTKLEEALHWLFARTLDRIDRGVEGKSEK